MSGDLISVSGTKITEYDEVKLVSSAELITEGSNQKSVSR